MTMNKKHDRPFTEKDGWLYFDGAKPPIANSHCVAASGSLTDSEILDWLDENTKEDGYPIEGWMQDMGYGNFDTLREWAIHEIENH